MKFTKFFGIILLILALVDFFSDPPILTIFLAILIIAGSIFCLAMNYKLKGFTIAALILSVICLIAGINQGKRLGFLKTPDSTEYSSVESDIEVEDQAPVIVTEVEKPVAEEQETVIEEVEISDEVDEAEEEQQSEGSVNPELKAFLDSYEAFMDEYIVFMKKYMNDPGNAVAMMADYMEFMTKYEEFAKDIEKYDSKEMSTEDAKYYLEVTTRCTQKMLDIYN